MRCCQTIQIFALSIAGIMEAVSSNFFKKTRFYHNILKLSRSGPQNPDSKFLIEALNAKALCAFGNICKFWLWVMKTSLLSPRLLITCLRTEQNNESDKLFWWPRWPWMSDDRWEVRETKKELCGTSRGGGGLFFSSCSYLNVRMDVGTEGGVIICFIESQSTAFLLTTKNPPELPTIT